jgi:polar amino acid transport system substrate-binding protein
MINDESGGVMKKTFWVLVLFLGYACNLSFAEIPGKISVGLNEPYPPYTIIESNKRPVGIFPEIIDAAAKILEIEVEYKQIIWVRMNNEAKKGNIDAVMGLFKTPDRRDDFNFSEGGLIYEEYSFFTLKDNNIKYSGQLEDFKKITIGVVQDYNYGCDFEQATFLKKEKCLTDQNVLEKLMKKRFDIAIGNKMVIEYYATKLNVLNKIKWLMPPVSKEHSHVIAFSKAKGKQAEELAREFSDAIKQLIENGTFKKILNKYHFDNKESLLIPTVKLAADDLPPYYGPTMPNNGPIAEIIIEAFKRVGYEATIDFLPFWINVMKSVKNGKYTAGFTGFFSKEREKDYTFSEPLNVFCRFVFLKKKKINIKLEKVDDLKPYRIGVTHGYLYNFPGFNGKNGLKKVPAISNKVDIENLIKGRLDLVLVDKVIADYIIDKNFSACKGDLDYIDLFDTRIDRHLLISKNFGNHCQLKRDFDYGLKQIKKDGTFDRIIKEYEKKYGYSYETNKD